MHASCSHMLARSYNTCHTCHTCHIYPTPVLQVPSVVPKSFTGVFDSGPRKRTACCHRYNLIEPKGESKELVFRFALVLCQTIHMHSHVFRAVQEILTLRISLAVPLPASPHCAAGPEETTDQTLRLHGIGVPQSATQGKEKKKYARQ